MDRERILKTISKVKDENPNIQTQGDKIKMIPILKDAICSLVKKLKKKIEKVYTP